RPARDRFASLAAFRLVLEALIGQKNLLAPGEYEFRTAFGALQNLIVEFHGLLPVVAGTRSGTLFPESDYAGNRWDSLLSPPQTREARNESYRKHPKFFAA